MTGNMAVLLQAFLNDDLHPEYNLLHSWKVKVVPPAEEALVPFLCDGSDVLPSDWDVLRNIPNDHNAYRLLALSLRMATRALWSGDGRFVRASLAALILDEDILDPRDVYRCLAIVNDAAGRLSVPFEGECLLAAHMASAARRSALRVYCGWPDYTRLLDSMAVGLAQGEAGYGYYFL